MTCDRRAMLELRHAFDALRAAWNAQAPTAEIIEHFVRVDGAIESLATQPPVSALAAAPSQPPPSAETPAGADASNSELHELRERLAEARAVP